VNILGEVKVTFKIMPESPEVNLTEIEKHVEKILLKYGKIHEKKVEPVAFGLKAVIISMIANEKDFTGDTEPIEEEIKKFNGVSDVSVIEVSRTMGLKDVDYSNKK